MLVHNSSVMPGFSGQHKGVEHYETHSLWIDDRWLAFRFWSH